MSATVNTRTIDWQAIAGTVYGGILTVNDDGSGTLTVDRASVDLGTLSWQSNTHATLGSYFYALITSLSVKYSGPFTTTVYPAFSSMFKCVSRNASVFNNGCMTFDGVASSQNVTQLQIKDSLYSDPDDFKNNVTGQKLIYELATPITYPLSDIAVQTLLGQNTMWADCGPLDVEYVYDAGTEGGKLALLLRNRKELLIAMRKGAPAAELTLGLSSAPSLGGVNSPAVQPIKPLKPIFGLDLEDDDELD